MDLVREVLRTATDAKGPFSQRGLSKAADLGRDAVGDIINRRNLNPTIKTLAALAKAMNRDLSIFGLEASPIVTSVAELQRALEEALPEMPSRDYARQARYLAEVVAAELGLPPDLQTTDPETRQSGAPEEDGPPPPATTSTGSPSRRTREGRGRRR